MATPTLDLVCCSVWNFTIEPANRSITHHNLISFQRVFNICAILSSSLSIIGAIYILLPKRSYIPRQRKSFRAVERQKKILTWLSVADVLACGGVLTMAIVGLVDAGSIKVEVSVNSAFRWTCIVATAWIQYYYVATYFWTFFYALDVNLMLRGSNRKMFPFYFIVGWLLPILMVTAGLIEMYTSSPHHLECDPSFKTWLTLLPHYLVSYVPMLMVLIVNPFMYWCSAKKIGPLLMRGGMFTDRERGIQRQVQRKFFFIVLVFTLCWLPNVINGCIMLNHLVNHQTAWHSYGTFSEVIWVAMAIMNPLQAFLNALIYWGPGGCTRNVPTQFDSDYNSYDNLLSNNHPNGATTDSAEETTPLVRSHRTRRDGRT